MCNCYLLIYFIWCIVLALIGRGVEKKYTIIAISWHILIPISSCGREFTDRHANPYLFKLFLILGLIGGLGSFFSLLELAKQKNRKGRSRQSQE